MVYSFPMGDQLTTRRSSDDEEEGGDNSTLSSNTWNVSQNDNKISILGCFLLLLGVTIYECCNTKDKI